jgi:hypothetical protein
MRRITFGSSMSAISSSRSPQRGHARTSKPKLRCISSAHSQFARDGIGVARAHEPPGRSKRRVSEVPPQRLDDMDHV